MHLHASECWICPIALQQALAFTPGQSPQRNKLLIPSSPPTPKIIKIAQGGGWPLGPGQGSKETRVSFVKRQRKLLLSWRFGRRWCQRGRAGAAVLWQSHGGYKEVHTLWAAFGGYSCLIILLTRLLWSEITINNAY